MQTRRNPSPLRTLDALADCKRELGTILSNLQRLADTDSAYAAVAKSTHRALELLEVASLAGMPMHREALGLPLRHEA